MSFIYKYIYKIFNKKKYLIIKNNEILENKIKFYNKYSRKKILKINKILQSKKTINFSHSGHLGDLIYSLLIIKKISEKKKCNLFIKLDKKINYHESHPNKNIMISKKNFNMLFPLLESQKYITNIKQHNKEKIDIDLDLFREMPFNVLFHSIRWYSHLTGVRADISEKFLTVKKNKKFKNKILILRTQRYKNYLINYKFLNKKKNLVFIGLKNEFLELKKEIKNLKFYNCKDFLEMAVAINSCKFFIGNLNFAYAIAEGLKVQRLLENSPDFPVVYPIGKNGYDFYHQVHFEKYFKFLDNVNKKL